MPKAKAGTLPVLEASIRVSFYKIGFTAKAYLFMRTEASMTANGQTT